MILSDSLQSIDTSLFIVLNSFISCTILNYFFVAITDARFWIIPGTVAAVIYIAKDTKHAITVICLALITVGITDPVSSQIIKPLFDRPRPCHPDFLVTGAHILFGFKQSLSFPSSHATNMFAQAMLLTLFYPSRWPWFFSFAALIGFSRIYVGVHYPGDVLGGAVLGTCMGAVVYFVYSSGKRYLRKAPVTKQTEITL